MRLASLALVAGSCLLAPTSANAGDDGEDVPEAVAPCTGEGSVFLRRIVELATGRPIANARVDLHAEIPHPVPGRRTPVASVTGGADGWVHIRASDLDRAQVALHGEPRWAFVEAPGFGPDAVMDEFLVTDEAWEIGPATTRRVALVDALDRPVVGARVGFLLGCGHTPDVRDVVTDAEGLATFEGVWGDGFRRIWPVAHGLRSRYLDDDSFAPWERPRRVTLDASMTVEGTVLGRDGRPLSGVAVGRPDVHRGPWTLTDAEGRFRLIGSDAEPGDDLQLEFGEYPLGPSGIPRANVVAWSVPAPPPGHRAVIRLPAPEGREDDDPPRARLVVAVDRTSWSGPGRAAAVSVIAVRVEDGWTEVGSVDESGTVTLDVPPGPHVVYALGRRDAGAIVYSRARADVVVTAGAGASVRLALPRPTTLRLVVPSPDATVELVADGARQPWSAPDEADAKEVLLPSEGPVAVRVTERGHTRLVPIERPTPPATDDVISLRIEPLAPTAVQARFIGGGGEPAEGWLVEWNDDAEGGARDPAEPPKGAPSPTPSLASLPLHPARLVAWPKDARAHEPSFIDVPARRDASPVDLGAVHLAPRAPALRLERADGRPVVGATVQVTRADRSEKRRTGEGALGGMIFDRFDAKGLVVEGATVRVLDWGATDAAPDGVVDAPFVRRLEGPGPWTLRRPGGTLSITVEFEAGDDVRRFTVTLDGATYEFSGATSRLVVRGLDAAAHDVVVEAPGHVGRRLRFAPAEGEARSFAARLRARPSR